MQHEQQREKARCHRKDCPASRIVKAGNRAQHRRPDAQIQDDSVGAQILHQDEAGQERAERGADDVGEVNAGDGDADRFAGAGHNGREP